MPITAPVQGVRAGTVAHFAANTAPAGWLAANGAAVSRTLYGALFTAIGTTYGVGDGSTTFNLPDLRGEFIRGWDNGRGVDSGRAIATAQTDIFKSHGHGLAGDIAIPGSGGGTGPFKTGGTPTGVYLEGGTETRPRNIAMLACIKF